MTSTETVTRDSPLEVNGQILNALRRLPEGFTEVVWNPSDGTMRAYREQTGAEEAHYRRMTTHNTQPGGRYIGQAWNDTGVLGTSFETMLNHRDNWRDISLARFPLPLDLQAALDRLPVGFNAVIRDYGDGELRAYRSATGRERVTCQRAFPRRIDGRLSYADSQWESVLMGGPEEWLGDVWALLPWQRVEAPVVPQPALTPSFRRAIEVMPPGHPVVFWDQRDGELRAFPSTDENTYQTILRMRPLDNGNGNHDYSGRPWEAWDRDRISTFRMIDVWHQVTLPLPAAPPFRVTQSLLDAVALLPEGYPVVWRDRADGELRAFSSATERCMVMRMLPGRPPEDGISDYTGLLWVEYGRGDATSYPQSDRWFRLELPLVLPEPEVEETPEARRIRELEAQLARRTAELATARQQLNTQATQHEEFKTRVASVGTRYAREHGWCSVVDEALDELGLERVAGKFSAVMTVTVRFTAQMESGTNVPSARDAYNWLNCEDGISDAIRDSISMDDSYVEEIEVDDITFGVTNVVRVDSE